MKIYGVEIKMPHSGDCTRSEVISCMVKDMQNHTQVDVNRSNLKSEIESSNFSIFEMQDVNSHIFGSFEVQ